MPVLEQEPPRARQTATAAAPPNAPAPNKTPAVEKEKIPFFHRPGVVIGAAILLGCAITYGATIFFHGLTHEGTDDAFVDAHIVSVASKVAGKIASVQVTDNQMVKKGDALLELDPRDLAAAVAQKRAALDVAKAHLENAQMAAEQAEAHVRTLLAVYASSEATTTAAAADTTKAKSDLERNKDLIESGAISKQDFQHSQADAKSAEATLDSKHKQLEAAAAYADEGRKSAGSARAQASAAKAEVAQAEAELRQAELQESYTRINAPEAGRVTNKAIEPGDYVQVGQPLLAIVPAHVWVVANFKETQLAAMRAGQPAEVAVDAYPKRILRGHVDSIQAGSGARFSLLPPENATGNFVKVVQRVPVKIALAEQPAVQQVLGPGMSAVPDVKVKDSFRPAVTVIIFTLVGLLVVSGGTIFWLGRVRTR